MDNTSNNRTGHQDNGNLQDGLIFSEESAKPPESAPPYRQQYIPQSIQPNALVQEMYQQNAQAVQGIMAANHCLGRDVANVTNEMLKNIHSLQRENAARKKEKVFKIDEDGFILICQCYDDGTEKILGGLSRELYVPIELHRLVVPKEMKHSMEILEIVPGDEDYTCYVPWEKVSGKTIYTAMIRAGIVFNPQFKITEVCSFLERMLLPHIDAAERILLNHLSGWNFERGRFMQGPFCSDWAIDCPMPRDAKIIEGKGISHSVLEEYVGYFRGITDEKLRMMLWIYPFVGITNSLLDKNGLCFQGVLNLVLSNSAELLNIVSFLLQTYHRHKMSIFSILDKSVYRCLGEAKDEVTVLKSTDVETTYLKQKQREKIRQLMQYACKEQLLPDPFNRELLGVLCILTKIPLDGTKVIHLYVEEEDFVSAIPKMGTKDQDVMQEIWFGYVKWIQLNWESVQRMIQSFSGKCMDRRNAAVFEAVYYLVERYFESLDVKCICKTMGLLVKPDFEEIFMEESDVEVVDCFIRGFRMAIQEYYVQDTRVDRSCFEKEKIVLFDGKSLSIKKDHFDQELSKMKIENKQKFLTELANMNMLIVNTDKFYYYQQLSRERFRFVKIRLELFERIGEISIIDLGKEKQDNVDR